jgi:hypothetical protein
MVDQPERAASFEVAGAALAFEAFEVEFEGSQGEGAGAVVALQAGQLAEWQGAAVLCGAAAHARVVPRAQGHGVGGHAAPGREGGDGVVLKAGVVAAGLADLVAESGGAEVGSGSGRVADDEAVAGLAAFVGGLGGVGVQALEVVAQATGKRSAQVSVTHPLPDGDAIGRAQVGQLVCRADALLTG